VFGIVRTLRRIGILTVAAAALAASFAGAEACKRPDERHVSSAGCADANAKVTDTAGDDRFLRIAEAGGRAVAHATAAPARSSAPSGAVDGMRTFPTPDTGSQSDTETTASADPDNDPIMVLLVLIAFAATASLAGSIVEAHQRLQPARRLNPIARKRPAAVVQPVADEQRCRLLLQNASLLWKNAEASVFQLDPGLPLRTLLFDDLKLIARRLAANPVVQAIGQGALTTGHPDAYWRTLGQGLTRTVRDLQRICAVAEAARASFGDVSNEPRLPRTMEEAYFVLGANPGADNDTLQRLVRALRQCWHPDLAQSDDDRRYREARIRQINVANDIIREQMSPPREMLRAG
jgi:hypothetical protein